MKRFMHSISNCISKAFPTNKSPTDSDLDHIVATVGVERTWDAIVRALETASIAAE
jgi:hypothetical protein